jgi:2-polyprenyl-3-methyl-5-hydroxy-6-metoxy-1,4-benzoquinol methylase
MAGSYALDNHHPDAPAHHAALADMFDPFTTERIPELLDLTGRRCWEVGAGGGSIALWLAEQVGDDGYVLASDTTPDLIPDHPRLRRIGHDLTLEPLPEGEWDLIHARLVLSHLPPRREILHRLVERLAPGGLILVEDWTPRPDVVMAAPSVEDAEVYTVFQKTMTTQVFAASGTDRTWGRQIHQAMLDEGLQDVQTLIHARAWPGGSVGCRLVQVLIEEVRPALLAAGLTGQQLEHVRQLLDDRRLIIHGHPMYSTSGRRPKQL